jgi:tetratricopeptide (TPR) repeat protein
MERVQICRQRSRLRALTLAIGLILLAVNGFASRHKLDIDPESKAGFTLQEIKQERSAAKKLEMMIQFVDEFPKDPNLPWVLEQLQPVYFDAKAYDKAIAVGDRLLAADPDDVDAANLNLKAAQEIKDPDGIHKYAKVAWVTADAAVQAGNRASMAAADWGKQVDFCRSVKNYAEYSVLALAPKDDLEKRAEILKWLEDINPKSQYLAAARQTGKTTLTANAASSEEAVKQAQQTILTDPDNVDALAVLSERANELNDAGHVLQYTGRLIELLSGAKPADLSDADWKLRKERYMASALWLNGITNSMRNNYSQADRSLRAVLPYIRGNQTLLSTGLYHLGYVNYQLAEKGEPNRVFEALKFNQECAQIKSNYQEQALKNIAAIKSEFNIP